MHVRCELDERERGRIPSFRNETTFGGGSFCFFFCFSPSSPLVGIDKLVQTRGHLAVVLDRVALKDAGG